MKLREINRQCEEIHEKLRRGPRPTFEKDGSQTVVERVTYRAGFLGRSTVGRSTVERGMSTPVSRACDPHLKPT